MKFNETCINCFKPTGGYEVCPHCGYIQSKTPKQLNHLYPFTELNKRYVIGRVINNGGFGVVYKAYDKKLNRIVAIKELFPTQNSMATRVPESEAVIALNGEKGAQFESHKQRFLNEARNMSKLSSCESIVDVYDFFEANNTAYLVMEYLEGLPLRDYLEQSPERMTFDEAMSVIEPVIKALSAAHKKNIIHRDVSPDNVFIVEGGQVKLLDFGAAKLDDKEDVKTITVVIKPGYTPPEQYRSKAKIKPYTDIYATAAMLYRMITGTVPEESVDRVEKDELARPSKLGCELPTYAEKALMKAMALNENARFKTIDDFLAALKGKKRSDYPEKELRRKKTVRWISFALAIILLIVLDIGFLFWRDNMDSIPKSTELNIWLTSKDKKDKEIWEDNINSDFRNFCNAQSNDKSLNIKLKIKYIDEDSYSSEFDKALKDGKAPDIYRSDLVKSNRASDLGQLYKMIDSKDMSTPYDVMKNTYSKSNQFAFRFDVPVLFVPKASDSVKADELPKTLGEAFDKSSKKSGSFVTDTNASYYIAEQCRAPLDDVRKYCADNALDSFVKGKASLFAGCASDWYYLRDSSGKEGNIDYYSMTLLPGEKKYCPFFPELFSVSSASDENEQKAARFFFYCLATQVNTQQDFRSKSVTGYLPMQKEAVSSWKNDETTINCESLYVNCSDTHIYSKKQ